MNKGIVMELSESSIIVMSPEGRFEKLPRGTRNCEVGEEILFAPVKRRMKVPQMAIASALAAAIVLCFVLVSTLTGSVPGGQVVAYVTIDINPSVEIGIDNQEIVQDLQGLNTDGVSLIQSMAFKGKSLEDVTSAILDKAEQGALAKGEGDIIISSTVVEAKATVSDEAIANKLKAQVNKHIQDAHPDQVKNYEVTAFAAPQEVRQEAKANGVSAGKYAIYLSALDNGTKVSLDDIKSVSIHQLAKDNGGIDKLVQPDKPIDKSTLKKLIEEEKSGKLNEKIQQLENEKSDKDKNNNKNNSKASTKPTKTPVPKNDKNDRNDKNGNNGNNGRNNSNNDRNNGNNDNNNKNDGNDDNHKPTNKPDNRDNSKPSFRPTLKPSPTPKLGDGSDADSKGKGNKDDSKDYGKDNNKDNKDNGKYNGKENRDNRDNRENRDNNKDNRSRSDKNDQSDENNQD